MRCMYNVKIRNQAILYFYWLSYPACSNQHQKCKHVLVGNESYSTLACWIISHFWACRYLFTTRLIDTMTAHAHATSLKECACRYRAKKAVDVFSGRVLMYFSMRQALVAWGAFVCCKLCHSRQHNICFQKVARLNPQFYLGPIGGSLLGFQTGWRRQFQQHLQKTIVGMNLGKGVRGEHIPLERQFLNNQ